MNAVNYKKEEFLTFDDQLLKDLKGIEGKIRLQFQTPRMHYPVAELLTHTGVKFFKLWDEKEFPTYTKETEKKAVKEYKGIYVFAQEKEGELNYQYVGISRGIRQRFQWHTTGTINNHATWAWLMLKQENRVNSKTDKELVKSLLKEKQSEVIHKCKFSFVPIESDMMLHLAEIYCANHLQTHWNSFRTH